MIIKIFSELVQNGFSLNFEEFKKINEKVKENLKALSEVEVKNQFVLTPNYFENKDQNYFGQEIKLVFKDLTEDYLEICDLKNNCEKIILKMMIFINKISIKSKHVDLIIAILFKKKMFIYFYQLLKNIVH